MADDQDGPDEDVETTYYNAEIPAEAYQPRARTETPAEYRGVPTGMEHVMARMKEWKATHGAVPYIVDGYRKDGTIMVIFVRGETEHALMAATLLGRVWAADELTFCSETYQANIAGPAVGVKWDFAENTMEKYAAEHGKSFEAVFDALMAVQGRRGTDLLNIYTLPFEELDGGELRWAEEYEMAVTGEASKKYGGRVIDTVRDEVNFRPLPLGSGDPMHFDGQEKKLLLDFVNEHPEQAPPHLRDKLMQDGPVVIGPEDFGITKDEARAKADVAVARMTMGWNRQADEPIFTVLMGTHHATYSAAVGEELAGLPGVEILVGMDVPVSNN